MERIGGRKGPEIEITVERAFGNLYRKRCVLIALEDDDGRILIGEKPGFYPPSINRLLGGGVDPEEEDLKQAAVREVLEETGIQLLPEQLVGLFAFRTVAVDSAGQEFSNETSVYYARIGDQRAQPGDDVDSVTRLSLEELQELGRRYARLSDNLWHQGNEGSFSWGDYAKMYGPIHILTAEHIAELRQTS